MIVNDNIINNNILNDNIINDNIINVGINRSVILSHMKNVDIIKMLLRMSIDPSINKNQAIRDAADKGYINMVKLLIKNKNVNPFDYKYQALRFTNNDEIKKILMSDERLFIDIL